MIPFKIKTIITCFHLVLFFDLSPLKAEEKEFFVPHNISHFRESKKILKSIYSSSGIDEEFYCGCKFTYRSVGSSSSQAIVLPDSCGLKARKNANRAIRLEWEHIVPAHAFGNSRTCWREEICQKNGKAFKGRKCCTSIDPVYRAMEADLHNLQPSAGELNADRGNFSFGMIAGEPRNYGNCDFEVDFKDRVVEPKENIRGDIARTYFYMEKTYGIRISDQKRKLFEIWNREDPPSDWEIERNDKIRKIQGNSNPFISPPK